MKLDKDPFLANMNTVEPTNGNEVIIGEERQPRIIRPKNLEIGRWKKNERSKPRSHPKVTFNIPMAKYRDGKAGFRGLKNRTTQFLKLDYLVSLDQASTSTTASSYGNQSWAPPR
jgi:hypothetical protein